MVFAEKAQKKVRDPDSNIERVLDLGFVGEVVEVDRTLLDLLARSEMIPVIAPVAPGRDGATYNINADTFAGAIAGALNASRLLFLTDVPGVLDKNGNLIKELSVAEAHALIKDGTISGGMIPKVETCIDAIQAGVQGVVISTARPPIRSCSSSSPKPAPARFWCPKLVCPFRSLDRQGLSCTAGPAWRASSSTAISTSA